MAQGEAAESIGSVTVQVVGVNPALLPCEYNFSAVFPPNVAGKNLLGCSGEDKPYCMAEPLDADSLYLKRNDKGGLLVNPLKENGKYDYLVRLPDGRGVAMGKVTPFELRYRSRSSVELQTPLDDGTQLVFSTIYMNPYVPGVELNLRAIISGLTLTNSRTQMAITTMDVPLNDADEGEYRLYIFRNKAVANKFCHTRQAQYYGTSISFCE